MKRKEKYRKRTKNNQNLDKKRKNNIKKEKPYEYIIKSGF